MGDHYLSKQLQVSLWFNVNTEIASKAMKDVYKHYKKYIENSRKQTKWLKENFSQDKMTETLKNYMDNVKVVVNEPLKLPKLKKIGDNTTPELPKLKLPKLQKIDG